MSDVRDFLKRAKQQTDKELHARQKAARDHASRQEAAKRAEKAAENTKAFIAWLWKASPYVIVGIVVIYLYARCSEYIDNRDAERRADAAMQAEKGKNPDNWWWDYYGERVAGSGQAYPGTGNVSRETDKTSGRITFRWEDFRRRPVIASCIPGHAGLWETTDGNSNKMTIRRRFWITMVTDEKVEGKMEQLDDAGKFSAFGFQMKKNRLR